MTYTEDDLTPWFPPDVKPVHEGVYQTMANNLIVFQYWDSFQWGYYTQTPDRAIDQRQLRSEFQKSPWRGLNKQP